ncbi:hypothetical protein ACVNPX_02960 [Staphylococcus aureus]
MKQFRQWGSKTPGHPEYRHTDGVEVLRTTWTRFCYVSRISFSRRSPSREI